MTPEEGWAACGAIVRRADADRWASARLAGPEAGRLMALYAFDREVARIPDVVSEPMLGEIRLQWWRDAVDEIFDGRAVRRHEVVAPLAEAVREKALPRVGFEAFLDARSYDLSGPAIGDRALFDAWLEGTGGRVTEWAARVLGADEGEAAAARLWGKGAAAAEVLRALPRLYARGGDPVPTPEALDRNALAEGRTPEALRATLREIAADGLGWLEAGRAGGVRAALAPAWLAGWRAEATLRAALRPGFEVFGGAGEPSEFRRRWGLLRRVWSGRV